jgi:hypothetical protein
MLPLAGATKIQGDAPVPFTTTLRGRTRLLCQHNFLQDRIVIIENGEQTPSHNDHSNLLRLLAAVGRLPLLEVPMGGR